jgi:O-antigen/teichoic acid export membrane protein
MQVLAWAGFAVIHLVRTIASTAVMAQMQFRPLFAMTLVSTGISIGLVILLIKPLGATGAIVGITSGEALLAGLAWRALLTRPAAERSAVVEHVQGAS